MKKHENSNSKPVYLFLYGKAWHSFMAAAWQKSSEAGTLEGRGISTAAFGVRGNERGAEAVCMEGQACLAPGRTCMTATCVCGLGRQPL